MSPLRGGDRRERELWFGVRSRRSPPARIDGAGAPGVGRRSVAPPRGSESARKPGGKLDSCRTPLYDSLSASLRSEHRPTAPECCPTRIGTGVRQRRNAHPPWLAQFLRKTAGLRSNCAPCGMPVIQYPPIPARCVSWRRFRLPNHSDGSRPAATFVAKLANRSHGDIEYVPNRVACLLFRCMILPKNWTSGLDGALQVKLIH